MCEPNVAPDADRPSVRDSLIHDARNHTLPFPRSYWVSHPDLLAGYLPGDVDASHAMLKIRALLAVGVRHIVNLMEANEKDRACNRFAGYDDVLATAAADLGVKARADRFPIADLGVPSTARMVDILDAVDRHIAEQLPVYVHCWGGRGRTGTVIGCWIARHGIAKGEQALERLAALRAVAGLPPELSPETPEQCDMVRAWPRGR